jgi:hypothetical protein
MSTLAELAEACQILSKYGVDGGNGNVSAEHDIIYLGCDPSLVSLEDKARLEKLRVRPCEEFDCWQAYC